MMVTMTDRATTTGPLGHMANGHKPVAPTQTVPMTPAHLDPRTARELAMAQQRIATDDAAAQRRLYVRAEQARIAREERQAQRQEKAQDRTSQDWAKAQRRAARIERRAERAHRLSDWAAGRATYIRNNAAAVFSGVVYATAVGVAFTGQVSIAAVRHWPIWWGILIAFFIEGLALSMALTAHRLRENRLRALAPRILTWVAAVFAATINYAAHAQDPILAPILAASSVAGITMWEIRSSARNRKAWQDAGIIPQPPEWFGIRRWMRYPVSTFQAWSLDIRDRVPQGAAQRLAQAAAEKAQRDAAKEARKAEREAQQAAKKVAQGARKAAAQQKAQPAKPTPAQRSTPKKAQPKRPMPAPAQRPSDDDRPNPDAESGPTPTPVLAQSAPAQGDADTVAQMTEAILLEYDGEPIPGRRVVAPRMAASKYGQRLNWKNNGYVQEAINRAKARREEAVS